MFRVIVVLLGLAGSAQAVSADELKTSDPLTNWAGAPAMARMQLATKIGKSFITLDEGFTAGFFLKCIDDVSTYGGAKEAKIEDAMRECVASKMRVKGGPIDDDE